MTFRTGASVAVSAEIPLVLRGCCLRGSAALRDHFLAEELPEERSDDSLMHAADCLGPEALFTLEASMTWIGDGILDNNDV